MFVYTTSNIIMYGGLIVVFTIMAVISIRDYFKQKSCPHDTYGESRSCHAICHNCGKDLGFIEPWRERDRARLEENKQKESNDESSSETNS